jgi:hypothetical protein
VVQFLADTLVLGALLDRVRRAWGGYELLDHWQQGEFHHDVIIRVHTADQRLPGSVLLIATNCNGGVKEVMCFAEPPTRAALWHTRCPKNPEFQGELPQLLGYAKTAHWFDPCELLSVDARSELKPEHRERQSGGGWVQKRGCS